MEYSEFIDFINKAKLRENVGDYPGATKQYEEMLRKELSPDQKITVVLGQAVCLLRSNNSSAAVRALENVDMATTNPWVNATYFNVLSSALYQVKMFNASSEAAQKAVDIATSQSPTDPEILSEALTRLGYAEEERGNYAVALKLFDKAKNVYSKTEFLSSIILHMAFCYENIGKYQDALSVLDLFQDGSDIAYSRNVEFRKGSILFHEGKLREAASHLHKAERLPQDGNITSTDIRDLLGRVAARPK